MVLFSVLTTARAHRAVLTQLNHPHGCRSDDTPEPWRPTPTTHTEGAVDGQPGSRRLMPGVGGSERPRLVQLRGQGYVVTGVQRAHKVTRYSTAEPGVAGTGWAAGPGKCPLVCQAAASEATYTPLPRSPRRPARRHHAVALDLDIWLRTRAGHPLQRCSTEARPIATRPIAQQFPRGISRVRPARSSTPGSPLGGLADPPR